MQHAKNKDHDIWSHDSMANRWETIEALTNFIFLGSKITADGDGKQRNLKMLAPWKESYNKPRQ